MTAPAAHPLLAELRRIRIEGGWTQDAVAACIRAGSRSTVGNWEAGTRTPNLESVTAYAAALGYELVLRRVVVEPDQVTPRQAKAHRAVLSRAALGHADDYVPQDAA